MKGPPSPVDHSPLRPIQWVPVVFRGRMGCVLVPEETSIGWAWRNPQGLAASILCSPAGVTSRWRRSFGLSHVLSFEGTGESSNLGVLKGGGGTGRVLPPTGPLGSMDPSGLERLVAGGITVLSWFPAARRHWDADSGMPWLVQSQPRRSDFGSRTLGCHGWVIRRRGRSLGFCR